jgi:hypothetical protein
MEKPTHTPTPWKVTNLRSRPNQSFRIAASGIGVAETIEDHDIVDGLANAEHIVLCVNAHDDLVAALANLMDQLEGIGIYIPGEDAGQWADAAGLSFSKAEQAIAKLEGGANAGCDRCGVNNRAPGSEYCSECLEGMAEAKGFEIGKKAAMLEGGAK